MLNGLVLDLLVLHLLLLHLLMLHLLVLYLLVELLLEKLHLILILQLGLSLSIGHKYLKVALTIFIDLVIVVLSKLWPNDLLLFGELLSNG
jgi:hypothetical protein